MFEFRFSIYQKQEVTLWVNRFCYVRILLYCFHRLYDCRKKFVRLYYINLFSLNGYKKNDKIIHECFKDKYDNRKRKP